MPTTQQLPMRNGLTPSKQYLAVAVDKVVAATGITDQVADGGGVVRREMRENSGFKGLPAG